MEDVPYDAELTRIHLEELDYNCTFHVCDSRTEYLYLLEKLPLDLIIADFSLPAFDGMRALELLRQKDDLIPFIFLTGTLGEENAVKAIKAGATDFITKNRMEHLPAAIIRALREREVKQKQKICVANNTALLRKFTKTNKQLKIANQIAKLGYWTHHLSPDQGEWSEEVYDIWERDPGSFTVTIENLMSTIHPDDRDLFNRPPEEFPLNQYIEVEHRILTPKGREKWIFQRLSLILDKEGNPIRYEGIAQDITEKKKLEIERESILQSITDGFFAVDADFNVTYWNKAAEHMLQITKEKTLNRNLWTISAGLISLKTQEQFNRALNNKEAVVFVEYLQVLDIWIEVSVFPKGDGLSVYLKNITERKKHQHELFRTIQETQEKERGRLGRDLHDGMTQTLSAIKMNLAYFKEKMEQGTPKMEILDRALEFTNNTINESRTISHGLLSVTLENYGLEKAIEEVIDNINDSKKLRIAFENYFPPYTGLPAELEVNIYRIVQESVNNMLKHSQATNGRILLIADSDSVQLIIMDNGVGVKGLQSDKLHEGAGLSNIRVRVEAFDGQYTLLNRTKGGLQIHIVFKRSRYGTSDSLL